ncbi:RNA recognition motif-containing protein [Chryseobacterium sp. H1D6B]|uniref:RNA recognition motif domain-containing protein n=1 Tax=Chryseobacterium sp. H1D6B TaxID=2940588 RepID=UPI0015CCF622|nr:RNA-binding protein [Chryseobacterium sp. H1D6B]MDH6253591.1 RNA recognition motif-containing protein [Chryseobacterium sp. H1D6B]
MNIFVSNINYSTKEYELQDLFSEFGDVSSAKIITDKETGRSRGFGFIEMGEEEGKQAIEALNQKEFNGKILNVSEAKPREEKPRRSFDTNSRSGGGSYGNNSRGGNGGGSYGNNRGGGGGNRW